MSVAYFIVLDRDEPGFETFVNGKAVAHASTQINKIAAMLGLKSLDELTSFGELEDEFDVPDDLREAETPWFEPEDGIKWAAAIHTHITSNPAAVKQPDRVIGELEEYEEVFEKAAKIGAKWHFQMDL